LSAESRKPSAAGFSANLVLGEEKEVLLGITGLLADSETGPAASVAAASAGSGSSVAA
jgi:hypothetical protein